ncbi:MAG: ATP-binding protein, partial [Treponema sp.]|nr:ATP-binding protein [Treponema sp.]
LFGPLAGRPALAIDGLDWEWKRYPVIRIDLNTGDYTQGLGELNATLNDNLEETAGNCGLSLGGETLSSRFSRLIRGLSGKYHERVAVLIDEYDKPLLSTIDNRELHVTMRNALKGFYSVLKSADEYLKFVLLTGVTKFSQVSVFSDLNNLVDISLDGRYADLCGISQEELERDFAPEIGEITREKNIDTQTYLDKLKYFYNGYRFSKKNETVYNPFGLLYHFNNEGQFDSYWFATGTPSFLVKLIEEQKLDILDLEKKRLSLLGMQKFNVDNMDALSVLYQSGYLTIVDYKDDFGGEYTLDYPNEEVRASFANALLERYAGAPVGELNALGTNIPRFLSEGKIDAVIGGLRSFFASIPYGIQIRAERYYQTVIHLVFRMLGLHCRSEVETAAGRIDTVVESGGYVYCFEFKLGGGGKRVTADEALRQIDSKEYLLPWRGIGKGKKLVKVGVVFDAEKRNIGEWKAEEAR